MVAKTATGPDRLTSQEKFHLVVESAALNEQELGEFCRRRSVFPEQLASWREAVIGPMSYVRAGMIPPTTGSWRAVTLSWKVN